MKTAAAAIIAAATLATAEPLPQHALPSGTKIDCSKPNANFCMGSDIILRCDGNSIGTKEYCFGKPSTYPRTDGVTCWESSNLAGDAACQKNCVVHAEQPFTLSADQCPGGQPTTSASTGSDATSTATHSSPPPPPPNTSTSSESSSLMTTSSQSVGTTTHSSAPPPPPTSTPAMNTTATNPGVTGTGSTRTGSTRTTMTTTVGTTPTNTPPTNDAASKSAIGGLFALGLAVAALF